MYSEETDEESENPEQYKTTRFDQESKTDSNPSKEKMQMD